MDEEHECHCMSDKDFKADLAKDIFLKIMEKAEERYFEMTFEDESNEPLTEKQITEYMSWSINVVNKMFKELE